MADHRDYDYKKALFIERFKSMDNYANAALRGLMYLNGGAAIILTKIFDDTGSIELIPLILFGLGTCLSVLSFGFASISQHRFMEVTEAQLKEKDFSFHKKKAKLIQKTTFGLVIASFICFITGIIVTLIEGI